MPIVAAVCALLDGSASVGQVVEALLSRPLKAGEGDKPRSLPYRCPTHCPQTEGGLTATVPDQNEADLKALARGGRTNVLGFVLRLAARIPFLFIAGRLYGPEVLGRFAYAILIVEFVAQLATLGLRRGLAEALSRQDRPDTHVVGDAMLVATFASALGAAVLIAVPQLMFPTARSTGSTAICR